LLSLPGNDGERQRARCFAFDKISERVLDRTLFVPYARALKTARAEVRTILAARLAKISSPSDLGELTANIQSPDPALRELVCSVLRSIGGRAVFQSLAAAIEQFDGTGRTQAIEALVAVAGAHAVPHLQSILARGKPQEKIQVLKVLGDPAVMGKATSVAARAIVPALEDKNEGVVQQALASFGAVCTEEDFFAHVSGYLESPNLMLVQALVEGLGRFNSRRVIAVLQRRFQAGPNKIRIAVLRTLERIGNEEILPPLVEALAHKHVQIRGAASEVFVRLSKSGKIDVAPTVVWLLRSKDVRVRRMAAEIAKSVPDPAGTLWPKMVAFIKDEDWWVRERVMDALVEMAGPHLAPHFLTYLEDPLDFVRRYAVDILARLRDKQALPALLKVSGNDSDWWVRERAVEAIASFKDERTVPHIVGLMKRHADMHLACLQALTEMGARSAAPYLAPALQSEDPDVRVAAVNCLAKIGTPAQETAVRALEADPDARVRKAVQQLLTQWDLGLGAAAADSEALSRLDRMLVTMAQSESDDLILESGNRPFVKRMGRVVPMSPTPLEEEQVWAMLSPHLSVAQVEELQNMRDVDFSYQIKSENLRFRANVFRHIGGISAVFRIIRGTIPNMVELGLPPVVRSLGDMPNGLVLMGGPTGSGKSTTLATLIDYINTNHGSHIVSLEDPIEVVHAQKKGLVTQREIGTHTRSFGRALRSTLRQDPDVILIGEMRDVETIHFAITAADTGHLVFGTVHTVSADTAVDRLINVFPAAEQQQVRSSLANSLRAVVCQYLLRRVDGEGRVLASEVMLNNDAISNLIRKGKTFQIPSIVATSRDVGMQSMDSDLMRLFQAGKVSAEEVYMKARNKKDFEGLFEHVEKAADSAPPPLPGTSGPRPAAPPVSGGSGPRPAAPAAGTSGARPAAVVPGAVPTAQPSIGGTGGGPARGRG
ncbi:MAG TPA: PilT/PilU family type 4a pilus ATPase, partial [bacterium]|nr:PilT/PilU family type 4a pilus ATPase [bacterium]